MDAHRSTKMPVKHLDLDVAWSPASFLSEQFPPASSPGTPALDSVIVLMGEAVDAYATTCGQYLDTLWPAYGSYVLSAIQEAVTSNHGAVRRELNQVSLHVTIKDSGTRIRASGSAVALLEIAETVMWLCCACRQACDSDQLSYALPQVRKTNPRKPSFQIHHEYEAILLSSLGIDGSTATCWRCMFRNPVIAKGYPIPARSNAERGLELTPAMMAILSQAGRAVTFAGKFFLKGFNSIVAPIKRIGDSVQWHFCVDKSRGRLPYTVGIDHSFSSCWDDAFFPAARHFVGWSQSVRFIAGMLYSAYSM